MSNDALEKLKQAKTSIKAERKPVSQVQDALKQAKEITEFVSVALAKRIGGFYSQVNRKALLQCSKKLILQKKSSTTNAAVLNTLAEMLIDF